MSISIFDMYKIGIGPSSSHTFGPMVAANKFIKLLKNKKIIEKTCTVKIDLYGSLALTGKGHGTFLAIELGLEGRTPSNIIPEDIDEEIQRIKTEKNLKLNNKHFINYERQRHFNVHDKEELPYHSNGMSISSLDKNGKVLLSQTYYSIGGGFVVDDDEVISNIKKDEIFLKYKFSNFKGLLDICDDKNISIAEIVLENEKCFRKENEIDKEIKSIIQTMNKTIKNGLNRKNELKGGLQLERRAPKLLYKLQSAKDNDPLNVFDWVSLWALAAAEENASLGQIVTAPTNGASAVIPAVVKFFEKYYKEKYNFENIKKFILTSGIVGVFCKENATISGAEGGCQAEMGSACAMAAAGLVAALGGTNYQIENAAIIGLSHNLGLTCDPVAGLVQVPCIERNAINAVKAVSASRLALREKKSLFVTLDQVILTMKEVGHDMPCKYKETSKGGLAINAKHGRNTTSIRSYSSNNTCCQQA